MRKEDKNKKPQVFVFFGLIASGKSTIASAWAARLGIRHYNSDKLRKSLAKAVVKGTGEDGRQPFSQGIYSEAFTEKTYTALAEKAEFTLQRGDSVVLDASYRRRRDREYIRGLAKKHGACARFILCSCPETELKRRMEERALDPQAVSDGRWEIYLKQKDLFEVPSESDELTAEELVSLSTMAPVDELLERLSNIFGL